MNEVTRGPMIEDLRSPGSGRRPKALVPVEEGQDEARSAEHNVPEGHVAQLGRLIMPMCSDHLSLASLA